MMDALRMIEKSLEGKGKAQECKWVRKALTKFAKEDVEEPLLVSAQPKMLALAAPAMDEGAIAVAEM